MRRSQILERYDHGVSEKKEILAVFMPAESSRWGREGTTTVPSGSVVCYVFDCYKWVVLH